MAEDLKIRVKVEPNPTGLQGKLDAISKKYKLNVELFDKKGLSEQISAINSQIKDLIRTTRNDLVAIASESAKTANEINVGVAGLAKTFGSVGETQKIVNNGQKKILDTQKQINAEANKQTKGNNKSKVYTKSKVANMELALKEEKATIDKLRTDGKNVVNQRNAFINDMNKMIRNEGISGISYSSSGVEKAVQDDISVLEKAITKRESLIKKVNKDGKTTYSLGDNVAKMFSGGSTGFNFVNDLMNIVSDILDTADNMDDATEKLGNGWKKFAEYLSIDTDDDSVTEELLNLSNNANEYADSIVSSCGQIEDAISSVFDSAKNNDETGVITGIRKLIDLYRGFIYDTGFARDPLKVDFSDSESKFNKLVKHATAAEDELIRVKNFCEIVEDGANKAEEALNEAADLSPIEKKASSLKNIVDKAMSSFANKAVGQKPIFEQLNSIQEPLYELERELPKAFNEEYISRLDDKSQETARNMLNLIDVLKNAHTELKNLFGEVRGRNPNEAQLEKAKTIMDGIAAGITEIYTESKKINSFKIGESATEVFDDTQNTAALKSLEESMRRLIVLQTNLTIAKKKTLEAEQSLISATDENKQKLTELLKQQQQLLNTEPKSAGGLNDNKQPDADVSGKASEAAKNAGKAKSDLKEAAFTVKEINTKGLSTVLKAVQKFVNDVCSDGSKVDAVQQKLAEFNIKMDGFESAIDSYTKAVSDLNTYFAQSATILAALNQTEAGTDGKKATAKDTETQQQTAAKLTILLNGVGNSSDTVKAAVHDASEALVGISKELTAAAQSSESVSRDGQKVLGAIEKLHNIFVQYENAMADTGAVAKAEETSKSTTKKAAKKTSTKKADTKNVAGDTTAKNTTDADAADKLNSNADSINKVLTKYKRVAKNTTDFAEQMAKIIAAGTKINAVIKKFNDISELAPNGLKLKIDTGKNGTAEIGGAGNITAKNVEGAAQSIKAGAEKIDSAAGKMKKAAGANETAAKENIKKASVLQADTINRNYNKYRAKTNSDIRYYRSDVIGTSDDSKETVTAYNKLRAALKNAQNAKAEFDATSSVEAYEKYTIAVRDLSDAYDAFNAELQNTRDKAKEAQTEMNALGKAMNARFNTMSENHTANMSRLDTASKGGSFGLIGGDLIEREAAAFDELQKAKATFAKDKSSANADAYRKALTNMSVAAAELKENLKSASTYVDNAFKAVPDKIRQAEGTLATLNELKAKTKNPVKVSEIDALIGRYTTLVNALKEVDTNGSYTQLEDVFKTFAAEGEKTGITIKSLKSLFDAMETQVRKTTSGVRVLNTELRDSRNLDSWQKSMQNTMYTAERYFNNNSKIAGDLEAYSRYVDFFNTYNEKITNREFTQENAVEMSRAWSDLKKYIQEAGLETDTLSVKLKKLFEVNIKSQLANQAINAFQQGLRQVYQNVVDIDTAMTELKKVTDETNGTYDKFLSEAGVRAKALGVSISDIVNATSDFARLGYNLEEATDVSNSAVLFKQVGDGVESMDDATSDIISAMKAFNIEAEDSIQITDKFNEVGNKFAITSSGVAEALKRSASSLSTAGNDIDQSIGMIVAANDVVQDPESVGAGLRVISLRIRGATTELESMGEEVEGVATSTAKLQTEIKALSGVNIMEDDNKTFKSTYQIMDELSRKWKDLTDIQQASITEKLAGKNRANIFSSMMNNWQDAQAAMEASKGSLNSATKELDTYLSSIEGKLTKFQATFQSFSSDVLDSGVVKGFIDMGTAALDFADGLVKVGDAMPTIATALSAVASMTNTKAGVNMPTYATGIAA